VWTSMGKAWLWPRIAPGQLAADADDPFADLQTNPKLKFGLYGVHMYSQREAVEKMDEAKAYAKAVKADDAEVPLHLWNERIRDPGVTQEKHDAALTAFQKLGHHWFLQGLARHAHAKSARCELAHAATELA
jgi:hypothetical protein